MLILTIFMLAACSSKPKAGVSGIKVTDQNQSYLAKYDKSLQEYMKEMTSILSTFNDALDGLYTQKYSSEQFAQILTGTIDKSNALVSKVESYDVTPNIFDSHQNVILQVNRAHQLLLDAVDMANTKGIDINKEQLRTTFLDIKTNQAKITNQWNILRDQLEQKQSGSKN